MFSKIPLLQLGDFKLEQMQKNLVTAVNSLVDTPFLNGILIQNIDLSTTTVSIPHRLKRKYVGYFITKLDANAVVYLGSTTEPETYLKLRASANCTVDVWLWHV